MTNDIAPTNDPTPDPLPGETPADLRKRKAAERRDAKAARAETAAETAAASTSSTPSAPKSPAPRAGTRQDKRAASARLALGLLAAGTTMLVSEADGTAIAQGAPDLAAALAKVAETSPRVAKALDMMTTSGAWSDVALAIMPIALAIAANHHLFGIGLDPADIEAETAAASTAAPYLPEPETPPWMQPFSVRPEAA